MVLPVSLSFLSAIEDLLADIFNKFLVPVIMIAFDFLWDLVAGMVMVLLQHLFFSIFTFLLKILLILEKVFDVFSCTTGVYVQNAAGQLVATSEKVNGYVDVTKSKSLLDVLMQSDLIIKAVLGMTAGAFALCFLLTIISVIKSMGEGIGEMKRPVSHVLRQTSKACLTFALIPLVCAFAIKLAGTTIAWTAMNLPNNIDGTRNKSAAELVSSALSNNTGAPRRGSKQSALEKAIAISREATPNAETRACDLIFYLNVKDALYSADNQEYYMSGQHFQNSRVTMQDVDLTRVNWLYALFETILVLIIFMKLIIEAMARIFMILILFVVSPYFVAMMPLDDGAKFKRWKEMFVGFAISSFGPLITMKTYLVLLPYIVTNSSLDLGFSAGNYAKWRAAIDLGNATGQKVQAVGAAEMIFRLFFIAAGCYAVYSSQNLILDLINPEVSKFLSGASSPIDKAAQSGLKSVTGGVSSLAKMGEDAIGKAVSGGGKK